MEVYKPKDKVSTLLFEVLNLSSFSVSDDFHCLYNMQSLNVSQLVLDICVKYVSGHLVCPKYLHFPGFRQPITFVYTFGLQDS